MCAAMAWCMAGTSTHGLARLCDGMLENHFGLRKRFIGEGGVRPRHGDSLRQHDERRRVSRVERLSKWAGWLRSYSERAAQARITREHGAQ